MEFSQESIAEFVCIWQDEFGEQLSPEEAKMQAERLLELFTVLWSSDYKL